MNLDDIDNDADRRDVRRTKVLRNAKIIAPRRVSVIHCTVQNITSGGACLKLANTSGVPEYFELTFELGRTRRPCRVIWRTADQLGVAFEEAATTAAGGLTSPKTPPPPRSAARCPPAATADDRRP